MVSRFRPGASSLLVVVAFAMTAGVALASRGSPTREPEPALRVQA
jgi:hypothetical protein